MKTYLLLITLFLSVTLLSQLNPKTKWGNLSTAEIDYKEVPFEKDAPAVILYEKGDMTIARLDNQNIIYKRIKILTEEGKNFANQEILYHDLYNFDEIRYVKAQSINIVDGKEVRTSVKNSEIYDTEVSGTLRSKRFAIPNVKVGTIIEFEYTHFSKNNYYFEPWRFQHEIPTLYSTFQINIQAAYEFMPICSGEKIVKYARENEKLRNHRNVWTIQDVPSIDKIDYTYNKQDAAEKIFFQLKGYININRDHVTEMMSWTDLNKKILDYDDKNIDNATVRKLSLNISPGLNEIDQIEKVLAYIRKNYSWNNYYSQTSSQSLENLDKNKRGNSADLNLLLNQLLKSKKIHAQLVLVSLRENGRVKKVFPFSNQFNTYINLITLNSGETILVDALYTDEKDYKFIPLNNFNQWGLILSRGKETFVNMNPVLSEYHSLQNYTFKDGKFVLTQNDKRNGYFKENIKDLLGIQPYNLQENSLDIFVNELRRDSRESDDNFEMERIISESVAPGSFMNIENPLRSVISQFQLKEQSRERALEFNFPFFYKTDVVIEIPNGYKVEIPQNFNVHNQTPAKDLVYFQSAEIKDGKLLMHIEFYLGKAVYDQNYAQIKAFFDKTNLDVNKDLLLKKN
ncbi:DUF3857 domain-containing protein [Moheibacter sp.]|uniref:DUF3857 domain-containing protein n=1 Tax=Moheibacter sp. TaxID=1965316 RepID=UPI003C7385FC